jgi:DNA repair exonuclease SbcCD ATPase subunit
MKFRWIKLTGYAGLYNGIGLKQIEIDFSKCKNNMIVIAGDNGSGKSTLFNALNILPDSYSNIIPNECGRKEGIIEDFDITYYFDIQYDFIGNPENGKRQTKAYIRKITNDLPPVEMNPSGNVTSYKDFIYNEFEFDSNYLSLTQLSTEDRGIVDKLPSERKKYVGTILNKVELYNDMHKTICKRESVYKSIISNINSKLGNIGDYNKLELMRQSLSNKIDTLESNKTEYTKLLSESEAIINILDPNNEIQNKYQLIVNELTTLEHQITSNEEKIKMISQEINIDDYTHIDNNYNELKKLINDVENNIRVTEIMINTSIISREEEAKSIQIKSDKLSMLQVDEYDDIENAIKRCRKNISEYEEIYNQMNLSKDSILTKDEYIIGLNALRRIKETIDNYKAQANYQLLENAMQWFLNGSYPDTAQIDDNINFGNSKLKDLEEQYQEYSVYKMISSKINQRPSTCKDDSCPFIKDAVDALSKNPDKMLEEINKDIKDTEEFLNENLIARNQVIEIIDNINFIRSLERMINEYKNILNKIPNGNKFTNKEELVKRISRGDSFKEIDELYQYINYANVIELYQVERKTLNKLEANYEIFKNKNSIVIELLNDIEEINTKLDVLAKDIEEKKQSLIEDKRNLMVYNDTLNKYELLIQYSKDKINYQTQKNNYVSEYYTIKDNIGKIKNAINNISKSKSSLQSINNELTPLKEELDKIKHNMKLYTEYLEELNSYSGIYEKIQFIKKCCSPTKGIQLLFIDLYMGQTIQLANSLLSRLFNGQVLLGNYIIDENEFRIPCVGNSLPVDDISSLSTSQRCMVSMIISFAMLQQSSGKFNILKLDEIDGGLDTANRLNFIPVLEYQMGVLHVEQCILITHNSEIDYSRCDVILLKHQNVQIPSNANIIYQY